MHEAFLSWYFKTFFCFDCCWMERKKKQHYIFPMLRWWDPCGWGQTNHVAAHVFNMGWNWSFSWGFSSYWACSMVSSKSYEPIAWTMKNLPETSSVISPNFWSHHFHNTNLFCPTRKIENEKLFSFPSDYHLCQVLHNSYLLGLNHSSK